MTKLLEHAVETVRSLPAEVQDDLARTLLLLAGEHQPEIRLTDEVQIWPRPTPRSPGVRWRRMPK
jgi:hypothetical protein